MRTRVFKFLLHLESGQVSCGKENQDAEIYFYHLFPFFLFPISHSNVIHREICVKDFSGTTVPRILKFGINVGYDLLYCVKENQCTQCLNHLLFYVKEKQISPTFSSLNFFIFLFLQVSDIKKKSSFFSQGMRVTQT